MPKGQGQNQNVPINFYRNRINYSKMCSFVSELNVVTSGDEELTRAVRVLSRCGCCPRCVLRFLGEKEPDVYRQHDLPELTAWVEQCRTAEPVAVGNAEIKVG